MAAVFTPGLKVTEHTIVQKDRRLPMEGVVSVSVGDVVKANQVIARTDLPGKVYPVNIANKLGVDPGQLKANMLKEIGTHVEEGEIIAKTPGFFGLFKSEATAPVSGTIESVSAVTGQVIFQAHPIPVEIDAYINGVVVEVHQGEGCVVQAAATLVQGIFGLGGEVKADLMMGVTRPDQVLDVGDMRPEMAGHIVIGGAYVTIEALRRAVELGVTGIVTGGFDYDEIKELLGYEVGVAITGGEDLGLTLIVTEGFGQIQMAPASFELLRSKVGRRASINGATQIRAGVIRPEVVVTFDDEEVPAERVAPPEPQGLSPGDTVRGIRTPWFGRIGVVVDLPAQPAILETESKARVMVIEFRDGPDGKVERATLPRANVETIEGGYLDLDRDKALDEPVEDEVTAMPSLLDELEGPSTEVLPRELLPDTATGDEEP